MIILNYELITEILPNYYRRNKTVRTDWLNLNVSATKSGYTSFYADWTTYDYLSKHNYQALSMEHCVNNLLPLGTDIYIIDGSWLNQSYWYNYNEIFKEQEYMYCQSETGETQLYLYNDIEFEEDQVDFFVVMSSGDTAYKPSIIKYIDMFKQGGKNYQIVEV